MSLYIDSIARRPDVAAQPAYPFTVASIAALDRLDFTRPITLLAGANGSGKSTLLEAMAAGMGAHAIGHHGQVVTDPYLSHARRLASAFYFARKRKPNTKMFMRAEDVLGHVRWLNEERLDNARYEMEKARARGEDVAEETPELAQRIIERNEIDSRSHGEGFLDILSQRLHGGALYFLDEPESPLSPENQLALATLIRDVADDNAQFIIATHSPVLLAIPEAEIKLFDADGVRTVLFDHVPSIAFLKRFLDRPGRFLDP